MSKTGCVYGPDNYLNELSRITDNFVGKRKVPAQTRRRGENLGRHDLPAEGKVSGNCKSSHHSSCTTLSCNCECHRRNM